MSTSIYDKILADIKSAMLSKDNLTRDCLRFIVSDIKNQTVNAGKPIDESACIAVLKKAVKQHKDSIESFEAGGREDLVEKETVELHVIEAYLPKMYSELEVQTLILGIVNSEKLPEVKASFGKIMKALNARSDKDLIDKKIASQYLNVLLK